MTYWYVIYEDKNIIEEADDFDETLLGLIHICVSSNQDYTLCGHATHEYFTHDTKDKPTCEKCIRFVMDCKNIPNNHIKKKIKITQPKVAEL